MPGLSIVEWVGRLRGREPLYTIEAVRTLAYGSRISCDKAKRELGYRARPLVDTLRDTYSWFASVGMIPHAPPRQATAPTAHA
jgi:nucleoside-diphosphate-sugar epimerase